MEKAAGSAHRLIQYRKSTGREMAAKDQKQDQQQKCDAEHGRAAAFGHPVRLILAAVPAGPAFSGAYFTSMRSSPRMMEATTFTTSFMSSC